MDLSLESTDNLIEEIKKRTDASLIITLQSLDSEQEAENMSYHGGKFTVIGLAEYAINRIIADLDDE